MQGIDDSLRQSKAATVQTQKAAVELSQLAGKLDDLLQGYDEAG